jgi:hypothetical protein
VSVQLHDGAPESRATVPAVVWQYAPDSWAVAAGMDAAHQTLGAETAVAAAIIPGANPLLLPAKVFQISIAYRLASTPSATDDPYSIMMYVDTAAAAAAATDPNQPTPVPSNTDPVPFGTVIAGGLQYAVSTEHFAGSTQMDIDRAGGRLSMQIGYPDSLAKTGNLRWAQFEPLPPWTTRAPGSTRPSRSHESTRLTIRLPPTIRRGGGPVGPVCAKVSTWRLSSR